ncbi:MAG: dihydrofolate reductase family protein [Marinoscillum sp.]
MRKIIAAINMTLDGICDHTAGIPDEEIHQHYSELIRSAEVVLYGSITFGLMKFWKDLVKNPSGDQTMDDFAVAIDRVPKVVFSNQLKDTEWDSAKLSNQPLKETVLALKKSSGGSKDVLVGSRSLIVQLMKLGLIDELQLCIYPVIEGGGLPLFEHVNDRLLLKLVKTKTFSGGAIILYYQPTTG